MKEGTREMRIMTWGVVWWICLQRWQRVSKACSHLLTFVAYRINLLLQFALKPNTLTHLSTQKQRNQKCTYDVPNPLNPTPPNTRSAHVHSQMKHARTLMSAAKGSTDSLPHPARCLCRPLLEENGKLTQTGRLTCLSILCFPAARGRTNLELREKFILPEGVSQGLAAFRSRGRRSKPGSRNASPTRSSSSASHSGASLPSAPSAPATPTASASSRVRADISILRLWLQQHVRVEAGSTFLTLVILGLFISSFPSHVHSLHYINDNMNSSTVWTVCNGTVLTYM